MYQRLSAHINSVDIPDFSELKETARETANRVETALARGGSTTSVGSGNSATFSASSSGHPESGLPASRTASVSSSTGIEPATPNAGVARSKSVKEASKDS